MSEPRTLIIEDEQRWRNNFRSWIPDSLTLKEYASTSQEATEMLTKKFYDLVILDLSMTGEYENRDNSAVQVFLDQEVNGTKYIIISGVIYKSATEVRDAGFLRNAKGLIFKSEISPTLVRETVERLTKDFVRIREENVRQSRYMILGGSEYMRGVESTAISKLRPNNGASGLYNALDSILQKIGPINQHESRLHLEEFDGVMCGLVWSRQIGKCVSIVLASKNEGSEEMIERLSSWLGYNSQIHPISDSTISGVKYLIFEEPNVSIDQFDTPKIEI